MLAVQTEDGMKREPRCRSTCAMWPEKCPKYVETDETASICLNRCDGCDKADKGDKL